MTARWKYVTWVILLLGIILLAVTTREPETPLPGDDRVQIRWFVGLQFGSNFTQMDVLEEVVADFNASQEEIELVLQVASIEGAYDLFATQISSGTGPDIVGPISWGTAVGFPRQWLNLDPYIARSGFDTAVYPPPLLAYYQTEEGIISLPFAVFPSAIFYVPALFDEMGLAYPPQVYGEKYMLDGRAVDWNWETVTEVARRLTIDTSNYNATQPAFDRSRMVQVGLHPQAQSTVALASFFGAARMVTVDAQGNYLSAIPPHWQAAWQWWHEGMWGPRPFMANGRLANTLEFGSGDVFSAGKAAMSLGQSAYTCCLHQFRDSGGEFQLGVLPMSEDGVVHGRIAESSFYIWQGTAHPEEAFTVLTYLLTTGSEKMLPAYAAMPAIARQTGASVTQQSLAYPSVTPESWHVLVQGLAYPDNPSADQYLPHRNEAATRLQFFGDLLVYSEELDFDAEFQKLQADLTAIYNK